MRNSKWLISGLVVILVAVTAVLVYRNLATDDAADSEHVVVTQTVTRPPSTTAEVPPATAEVPPSTEQAPSTEAEPTSQQSTEESTEETTPAEQPDGRPASNVPMTKLKPGEKAPQFIIFSFDGAGSHEKWHVFMDAARESNARFTGFLTGLYLLGDPGKSAYTGPGHGQGKASIGFGGPEHEIVDEVNDLNQAYSEGHEIGTHYNGHFCSDNPPGGAVWTTDDWNNELDQFFTFMRDWKSLNGYTDAPDLIVPTDHVKGGRTPCLEGELSQLIPAWKNFGFTYDSSINAPQPGIFWPQKIDGIWEFYMPVVHSPGFGSSVLAMDYNFWIKYNSGAEQPETAPELRQKVRQTYDYMYEQAFNGNRAPVLIANHFNKWNGDSFNVPAEEFMRETCTKPDTYCATYQDVIAWMELQDPEILQELLDAPPVATG